MEYDQVLTNERKDKGYNPYCMRCSGLQRMIKVSPSNWKCPVCPAKADRSRWFTVVGKHGMVYVLTDGESLDLTMLPADVQEEVKGLTFHGLGTPCVELMTNVLALCHPRDAQHLRGCEDCSRFWEQHPLFAKYWLH